MTDLDMEQLHKDVWDVSGGINNILLLARYVYLLEFPVVHKILTSYVSFGAFTESVTFLLSVDILHLSCFDCLYYLVHMADHLNLT